MAGTSLRKQSEQRRHRRQPLNYAAWIVTSPTSKPLQCMMSDVSKSGAKLAYKGDAELPDRFMLLLSNDGKTRRMCRVAWREGSRMGVEFLPA
jgi:hypothetical protein